VPRLKVALSLPHICMCLVFCMYIYIHTCILGFENMRKHAETGVVLGLFCSQLGLFCSHVGSTMSHLFEKDLVLKET